MEQFKIDELIERFINLREVLTFEQSEFVTSRFTSWELTEIILALGTLKDYLDKFKE